MRQKIIKKLVFIIIIAFILINGVFVLSVSASTTDGTIDSTYKYAWGENIGWVNFGCDNCDVHITDSGLSGYALSETIGWIYLGDITNDGAGNLSGYAWSENAGWLKFNPTNGGVVINSSGEFTGSALGENIGWVIFNGDYQVKTDWRAQSARPACNNATDDDGDGKIDYPNDPGCDFLTDNDETDSIVSGGIGFVPNFQDPPTNPSPNSLNPKGEFKIIINPDQGNHKVTDNPIIKLKFIAGPDTKMMSITQDNPDFVNASLIPYQEEVYFDLCKGSVLASEAFQKKSCHCEGAAATEAIPAIGDSIQGIASSPPQADPRNDSEKSKIPRNYSGESHTIYVKFYTKYGYATEAVSANIILLSEITNSKSQIPNKSQIQNSKFKTSNQNFAYNKPRLASLSQEQNIAKDLKNKLEEHYEKNKIPVHKKHWPTIVNSYIYGNYPIKAIIKAIKFGGKTVHPTIPYSAWQRAKDYLDYIGR